MIEQPFWVHNLSPYLIDNDWIQLPFYWLVYVLSFMVIHQAAYSRFTKFEQEAKNWEIYSAALGFGWLGMLVGARLFYVTVYFPEYFLANPSHILEIWRGGMSFHGAIIGGAFGVALYCRFKKTTSVPLLDLITLWTPLGLFFGRIANFLNGELVGTPSSLPWAVIFPSIDGIPRHPSQIYEALGEGLILGLLMYITNLKYPLGSGRLIQVFLIGYGSIRLFIEQFRMADPQLGRFLLGLSMGQILCLIMITIGTCMFFNQTIEMRPKKTQQKAFKIDS